MRPSPWKKRTSANLSVKLARPASGDDSMTCGASAIRREFVIFDEVSVAADQRLAAIRARRIFQIADLPREIPGINVAQSNFASNGDRA